MVTVSFLSAIILDEHSPCGKVLKLLVVKHLECLLKGKIKHCLKKSFLVGKILLLCNK